MWILLSLDAALAACDAEYSLDRMVEDLSELEAALRERADAVAGSAAVRIEAGLVCLDSPLNPTLSARVYRSMGAGFVAGGELEAGQGWMRTSAEAGGGVGRARGGRGGVVGLRDRLHGLILSRP